MRSVLVSLVWGLSLKGRFEHMWLVPSSTALGIQCHEGFDGLGRVLSLAFDVPPLMYTDSNTKDKYEAGDGNGAASQ